jgi:hypothetical protein
VVLADEPERIARAASADGIEERQRSPRDTHDHRVRRETQPANGARGGSQRGTPHLGDGALEPCEGARP